MNEQKPETMKKPEELLQAEKLIDDAKVNEARELLTNFEKKESLTLHDRVASHLLRADLLYQQGRYGESLALAEQTYKESLELGKNLQSVDCLIFMAKSLFWLGKLDKLFDVIIQAEELLKSLTQVLSSTRMKREAQIAAAKGTAYWRTGKMDLCLNFLKQSLDLAEKTDLKTLSALLLGIYLLFAMAKGDIDIAFEYGKKSLALAKESKSKASIANSLFMLATIYHIRGDGERQIKKYKEALSIYEELDNREKISLMLGGIAEFYRDFTEDYDRASEYIEKSLALYDEDVNHMFAGERFYIAITIALKKGDHEGAKKYLQNLKQMKSQVGDKALDARYRISKALVSKSSSRFHDKAKAEKLLRQIVTEEGVFVIEFIPVALINLCDILLGEFQVTNNLEILHELEPLITHLLSIAEKTRSYRIQAETYLFQAKLALLTFDVKKSRRFLTQAQQIAERRNLNKLAQEISNEHKNLIDSLESWEQLKDSEAPLSERFKLAQISEQMERMHRTHVVTTQIIEEEVSISKEKKICPVCRGEVLGFSYACKCGANYCESCAKALSNLENVCWACDIPIDHSKPSKPYKEEEEPIKVQEEATKK
jgi:tetratricopeptide (TPR) repeat protein